jgi:hypothetical protein
MALARPGYKATVIALGAVGATLAAYAISAAAVSPTAPASTCRASLLRIELGGQLLAEPFVANDAGAPCTAENSDLIGDFDLDPLPVSGRLLYSRTNAGSPQAESGVADIEIALGEIIPDAPTLGVQVLTSEAGVSCNNGTASTNSHSRVVGLTADGEDQLVIPPGDDPAEIPIDPLINVKLNETVHDGNTVTQRALHINALAGNLDIVVAEAIAGFTGNPCATGTTGETTGQTTGPTTGQTTGETTGQTTGQTTGETTGQTTGETTGQTTGETTGQTTGETTGQTTGETTGQTTGGEPIVGWMTGGGQIGTTGVSHGFVLPCTLTQAHPGPQLTVSARRLGSFHLDELTSVSCTEHSDIDQENPEAGFDTITGTGTGTCKGQPATISFTFVDGGEPNDNKDQSTVTVSGGCTFSASGPPVNGNNQAHKGNNPPA